jgi:hypothetical protein
MRFRKFLVLVSSILTTGNGWGGDGHRIITGLALKQMPEHARRFLMNVIGDDETVIAASLWADSEDAKTRYPGSQSYHFCFTRQPGCGEFEMNRDCGNWNERTCIVTALENVISTIVDIDVSSEERQVAMKFLLHLMGDIHQPLHVGFRSDNGGNRIVLDHPDSHSLHTVWDTWIIDRYMRTVRGGGKWRNVVDALEVEESASGSAESFPVLFSVNSTGSIMAYTASLASHTATQVTCAHGYTDERGRNIQGRGETLNERGYLEAKIPVVKSQLRRASRNLSFVMTEIATEFNRRREVAREARREARIASLFAPLIEQASRAAADPNGRTIASIPAWDIGFCPRAVFEEEEEEDRVRVMPTTSKPKATASGGASGKGKSKSTKAAAKAVARDLEDDEALEAAIAESAELAKKISLQTFNGIDLSKIAFRTHHVAGGGYYHVVTDKEVLKRNPTFVPTAVIGYETYLSSPEDGVFKLERFHFDSRFFSGRGKLFNDEVKIRALLKISGKDCTIDVSDYLAAAASASSVSSAPAGAGTGAATGGTRREMTEVLRPFETLMEFYMIPEMERERAENIAHWSRIKIRRTGSIKKDYRFLNRLESLAAETLIVTAGKNVRAFVLPDTLAKSTDWIKFNLYVGMWSGTTDLMAFLIDVDIYEGCTDIDERLSIGRFLEKISSQVVALERSVDPLELFKTALSLRPTFYDELKAINYLISTEDDAATIAISPNRRAIEKYAIAGKADLSQQFARVHWKRGQATPSTTR